MSRQFGAAGKKKVQAGLVGFLAPKPVPSHVVGYRECPYCFSMVSPQGLPNHMRAHCAKNHQIQKRTKYGKAKVRFDLMTADEVAQYHAGRELGEVVDLAGGGEVIELEGSGEESGGGSEGESTDANAAPTGRGTKRLRNDDDDEDDSDWEEDAPGEGAGEDDNAGGDEGEEAAPAAGVVRGRNWHPSDIVKVFKDYDCMNGRANHSAFARYVQGAYKRPKFQAKRLRDWLAERQEIEESARQQDSDRRNIAVPRQSTGQYPEMEHRLAQRIRCFRENGLVVHTWMVVMEGKMLLHELLPEKFPAPRFDDGDDANFSFKFSRTWMDAFFVRFDFTRRTIGTKMNKKGACHLPIRIAHQFY